MAKEQPDIRRPWGGYTIIKKTHSYWIKKLYVNSQARLSLQSHKLRTEVWVILEGSIIANISGQEQNGRTGDFFFVPARHKHRITGLEDSVILEIAFGEVLETDIERYKDDYGRR